MINFAFIGCGKVAGFHADVINALGHRISSVSARKNSSNIEKFANDFSAGNTFDSWEAMLENDNPDAIIVAVSWDQTEHIIEEDMVAKN